MAGLQKSLLAETSTRRASKAMSKGRRKGQGRVFLAYAREDETEALQLYATLIESGFSPWIDKVDLMPGQNWPEVIPRVIHGALATLACFSNQSISKRGYVQKEYRYALSAHGSMPPGSINLIPVRLDKCDIPDLQIDSMSLSLRHLQWVDLFEAGGLERLISALALIDELNR